VIGVQGDAKQIVEGAVAGGVKKDAAKFFETPQEAGKFLAEFLRPGDLLLVKGSRSVKMERIIEELLGRFVPSDPRVSAGVDH
jgi:UDP-N-acetylmuramoyl-tripeptide--D-alanyl-D-alanine ligase